MIDMPKVSQMLDNGWRVFLFKNQLGSYTAWARHANTILVERIKTKILQQIPENLRQSVADDMVGWPPRTIQTEDFTPEAALTRLAYKIHGEILGTKGGDA